jgi:hypothetical protein
MSPLRWLVRLGLLSERRARGQRLPIFIGARLDLDGASLNGTARDLSQGGVFLETSAALAPGSRGLLSREGSDERIPVRVSWRRSGSQNRPIGIGLAFEGAD